MLGQERARNQYPVKTLSDHGAHVCFGSDWFVSSIDPLQGIAAAVLHRGPQCPAEEEGWLLHERISLEEAIRHYTLDAAVVNFLEEETGSIEVGKRADMIVLNRNLFECPLSELGNTKVLRTYVDGECVYQLS
jgi:predicted amidohydrolase YtcJ